MENFFIAHIIPLIFNKKNFKILHEKFYYLCANFKF
jgi:hypothetical protein